MADQLKKDIENMNKHYETLNDLQANFVSMDPTKPVLCKACHIYVNIIRHI